MNACVLFGILRALRHMRAVVLVIGKMDAQQQCTLAAGGMSLLKMD